MHHGLSVTPYIFTDFVNVTKFIESMSKHDGNVTHSINVTALEVVETLTTFVVQVSESDGKISARKNCHHSLFCFKAHVSESGKKVI